MSAAITNLSEENFESEINSANQPVLVDFWAEWCGPCKMIAPILEEIADEQEGVIKIAKVDVDNAEGSTSLHREGLEFSTEVNQDALQVDMPKKQTKPTVEASLFNMAEDRNT